ncbi:hypothetical protein NG798_00250 [Ancylothrix sp. C2]|uniref:COG1470 family protein n=1 Tax=Ancylothrix sp. D3o TaxID=2953691 RepID=UPI0021BA9FE0|nr:hypothetical protein [Ancylothrix sp. D3o]MCT7948222.1 hypothetical protein [Ancylothrix sp. D3o]
MAVQNFSLSASPHNGYQENDRLGTLANPLAIILNPSGDINVMAGSVFEISITITNQGDRSALIDIFIDESCEVAQWCLSPGERVGLNRYQSTEVVLQFEVPLETPSDTYDYLLKIDAPKHYPEDTPIDRRGRVVVMPFIEETRTATDPTFSLQPATNSVAPARLQPGSQLQLQAFVHNRSDRVDRFYLSCSDVPDSWLTVIYPENLPLEGLFASTGSLELNPGEQNQILLMFNPPLNTPAGIYAPTVRLHSTNHPDLILLDLVHLEILPTYLLNVELVTLQGKVKNKPGLYELRFQNLGNTPRSIQLQAKNTEEEQTCSYTFAPDYIHLGLSQESLVGLQVKPTKRWRPFSGQLFNFIIELEDKQQLPLTLNRFQGSLMWEPRPWWQFLLLVLAITGSIASVIFLIFWLLTRPPRTPKLLDFSPERSFYQEFVGDRIRLNWKIANPDKIQSLKIIGLSPEGKVISGPFNYDLSANFPPSLQNFCQTKKETGTTVLLCQNVWTDARAAGNYIFELTVTPKQTQRPFFARDNSPQVLSLKTNTITISATPLPKIVEFSSDQPVYKEGGGVSLTSMPLSLGAGLSLTASLPNTQTPNITPQTGSILLNWKVINVSELKELTLIGRAPDNSVNSPLKRYDFSQGIPPELKGYCLTNQVTGELPVLLCQKIPTGATSPGDYVFELAVIPKTSSGVPSEIVKTNTLKILPLPGAKILEFASTQPAYQEAVASTATPSDPASQPPATSSNSVLLNWKVANPKQIKELTLIGRAPDNSVISPLKRYDFSNGTPAELQPYCVVPPATNETSAQEVESETLVCQNVPTNATQAGEYIFELTVIQQQNLPEKLESQKTEKIKVTAAAVVTEITEFNINGKPAPPKYIVDLATNKERFIIFSWQVQGSKNIKVELVPSPGSVLAQGQVAYPISPEAGTETLTLQVTNEEGKEIKRSVIIERLAPPPPPPPAPPKDGATSGKDGAASGKDGAGGDGAASGKDGAGAGAGADGAGAGDGAIKPPPDVPLEPAELSPQVN